MTARTGATRAATRCGSRRCTALCALTAPTSHCHRRIGYHRLPALNHPPPNPPMQGVLNPHRLGSVPPVCLMHPVRCLLGGPYQDSGGLRLPASSRRLPNPPMPLGRLRLNAGNLGSHVLSAPGLERSAETTRHRACINNPAAAPALAGVPSAGAPTLHACLMPLWSVK